MITSLAAEGDTREIQTISTRDNGTPGVLRYVADTVDVHHEEIVVNACVCRRSSVCTYAIALIYHSAVYVQWHRPPSFIIHDLTLRHPSYMRAASFYSVYSSCIFSPPLLSSPSSHLRFLRAGSSRRSLALLSFNNMSSSPRATIFPIYTYAGPPTCILRRRARGAVRIFRVQSFAQNAGKSRDSTSTRVAPQHLYISV